MVLTEIIIDDRVISVAIHLLIPYIFLMCGLCLLTIGIRLKTKKIDKQLEELRLSSTTTPPVNETPLPTKDITQLEGTRFKFVEVKPTPEVAQRIYDEQEEMLRKMIQAFDGDGSSIVRYPLVMQFLKLVDGGVDAITETVKVYEDDPRYCKSNAAVYVEHDKSIRGFFKPTRNGYEFVRLP